MYKYVFIFLRLWTICGRPKDPITYARNDFELLEVSLLREMLRLQFQTEANDPEVPCDDQTIESVSWLEGCGGVLWLLCCPFFNRYMFVYTLFYHFSDVLRGVAPPCVASSVIRRCAPLPLAVIFKTPTRIPVSSCH